VFNSLSAEHQKIIEIASGYTNIWSLSQYLNNNGSALERLKAGGVKVLEFPDSVWDAFGEGSQQVYAEFMGDDLFKEIFDDYNKSMRDSSGWLTVSTGAYRAQRDRVMG